MKDKIKKLLRLLPYGITYGLVNLPFLKLKSIADLKPYFSRKDFQNYWLKYAGRKEKNKVIIYGLRSYATHHQAVFEKVISDVFRFNGANVKNLICGGVLPSCDGAHKYLSDRMICNLCRKQRKYHLRNFPNDFLCFRQFISKKEINQLEEEVKNLADEKLKDHRYLEVQVGRHAFDSVEFGFQFIFDSSNQLHLKKLRESLYLGMITVKVAQNLYRIEKPTHLLTLHGCYASWGPFAEYLSKQGVAVYVYEVLLTPGIGYFQFYRLLVDQNNMLNDSLEDARKKIPARWAWEQKKKEPLAEKDKEQIHSFLAKRKEGKSFDYLLFYERKKGKDLKIIDLLNSDKKKFVLYMHSLWDRAFEDVTSDCFTGHLQWLKETIDYFISHQDSYLFIKPHPAEFSVWEYQEHGGNEVILNLFEKLPDNIILMKNNLPFTSYDLMDKDCIGITYYGTVGLEYPFFKKPILVAGNTHYIEAKAAYKVKSKQEYFQLIDNPEPLRKFPYENYDLIEKYAFHYFFRQSMRIPFYRDDVWLGHCIDWDVLRNYKDFIESDKTMNHIVQSILNHLDVIRLD